LLTARRARFEILEAQQQFPGGGIGTGLGFGFGIPVFGSGGAFAGGIRGGLIPGGGFVAGAGSGIGPVLTLEAAFDVGFTSAEIAATIQREDAAIRAALSEGREAVITISTGQQSGLTMVLNLAKGLFEIFDKDGRKLGGGVTPEAAIEAVNAGAPPLGGGGGSEPFPFPRRSPPSRPLPLSHLRRLRLQSLIQSLWRLSCHLWASYFGVAMRPLALRSPRRQSSPNSRRSRSPTSRPLFQLRLKESDLEEQSTSPLSWARRVIPREYDVQLFQIRNNSTGPNRSGNSSSICSGYGKQDRTPTSSAEHLNSS